MVRTSVFLDFFEMMLEQLKRSMLKRYAVLFVPDLSGGHWCTQMGDLDVSASPWYLPISFFRNDTHFFSQPLTVQVNGCPAPFIEPKFFTGEV